MFKPIVRRFAAALLLVGFFMAPTFTVTPPIAAPTSSEGPGGCPVPGGFCLGR